MQFTHVLDTDILKNTSWRNFISNKRHHNSEYDFIFSEVLSSVDQLRQKDKVVIAFKCALCKVFLYMVSERLDCLKQFSAYFYVTLSGMYLC